MAIWSKTLITLKNGEQAEAIAPVIISASRRTDIPAFYAHWFQEQLEAGYCQWKNPVNGKISYISFSKAMVFVFWSKNPRPFFPVIEELHKRSLGFYFQFTLNDYENEGLESNLPPLSIRIETFRALSRKIGAERVIWRFDPLIKTANLDAHTLLKRIEAIAEKLAGYTDILVFSFVDIKTYRKVISRLNKTKSSAAEWSIDEQKMLATALAAIGRQYGMKVETCAETADFSALGIDHGRCIDDRLIAKLFPREMGVREFLFGTADADPSTTETHYKKLKDKGQRKACGCILSKDIGMYDTCPFNCVYCYANSVKGSQKRMD